jgi:hypothetical protein
VSIVHVKVYYLCPKSLRLVTRVDAFLGCHHFDWRPVSPRSPLSLQLFTRCPLSRMTLVRLLATLDADALMAVASENGGLIGGWHC